MSEDTSVNNQLVVHVEKELETSRATETIDLTISESIVRRALPDFKKLRGAIYQQFSWSDKERLWECSLCKTSLQHHPQYGTATLNKHFKEKHPKKFEELKTVLSIEQGKQWTLDSHLKPDDKPKPLPITKEGVRSRLAELVVDAGLPFTIYENKKLEDLLSYVSRGNPNVVPLPTRNTGKADIEKLYENRLKALQTEISNNEGRISLIIDCWTSSNQNPYQGVVATWIDNSWRMQSCILDLTPLEGSHSGENLANALEPVLDNFKLWDKLMAVTSDNASNMNTMFKKLDETAVTKGTDFNSSEFRVRCLAHIINLACQDLLATAEKLSVTEEDFNEADECENWEMGNGILKNFAVEYAQFVAPRNV